MALDKFISCDTNGMTIENVLKSLEITHADGTKGYRIVIRDVDNCADITERSCDETFKTLEQGFRERIVLDPCGKPAIMLLNTEAAA